MDALIMKTINMLEDLQHTMQSYVFLRGLKGIMMVIAPLEGEEAPPTWEEAVLQYERAFPYKGVSFQSTFSLAERDACEKIYACMAAEKDAVQANQQTFLNIVEQFIV